MNQQAKAQQRQSTTEVLNALIIDSIKDIKGKNILKLDLRGLDDAPTDFFIVCEGDSNTQVKAISDNIQKRLKKEASTFASHVEGERTAQWICLDYFYTVAHVFHQERRDFYELENLWSDAKVTQYQSL